MADRAEGRLAAMAIATGHGQGRLAHRAAARARSATRADEILEANARDVDAAPGLGPERRRHRPPGLDPKRLESIAGEL